MMTMFAELYALATTATLTMVVSADEHSGRLTISVLPKPKKEVGEPALAKDLTLTATPEEFDAGFVAALRGYRVKRASLMEQAEATKEVLDAATSLSAKKAADAMEKASKPAPIPKSASAPAKKAADDEKLDDEQTDDGAGAPVTPGESLQLFG